MVTNNAANAQNAQYNLLVGTGSAYTNIAPSATSGVPLISQGAASNPAYGTAVVAGGGTGVTSNTAYAVLCGGTTGTGPIQSVASVGSAGQVLTSNGALALPTFQAISSSSYAIQQKRATLSTFLQINTYIPEDDTIPQITEGTQVLSLAITPTSATSVLEIQFSCWAGCSGDTRSEFGVTLFEAASTNAIQVCLNGFESSNRFGFKIFTLLHNVTSGTTSPQTYSIRMGVMGTPGTPGNNVIGINGNTTARLMGGASSAKLIITEYAS